MVKGKFSFDLKRFKPNTALLEALFKPKAPPLIGADVSSSGIKMVELTSSGAGQYRIERYAIEALPKDSVVDGNIHNLDAVCEAIKRCHKRLGTNVKNLALALPNAAVISKKIMVPAGQTEEELEVQVETEANQYIPFSLDEVNLDFQVLGPAPKPPDSRPRSWMSISTPPKRRTSRWQSEPSRKKRTRISRWSTSARPR
jgi:type IV pilus assembly protein PilM